MYLNLKKQIDRMNGRIDLFVFFKPSITTDKHIERIVHKKSESSGICICASRTRDLSFTFKNKRAIKAAIDRLSNHFGKSIKIQVWQTI